MTKKELKLIHFFTVNKEIMMIKENYDLANNTKLGNLPSAFFNKKIIEVKI